MDQGPMSHGPWGLLSMGQSLKKIIWSHYLVGPPPTGIGIGVGCNVSWVAGKVGDLGMLVPGVVDGYEYYYCHFTFTLRQLLFLC